YTEVMQEENEQSIAHITNVLCGPHFGPLDVRPPSSLKKVGQGPFEILRSLNAAHARADVQAMTSVEASHQLDALKFPIAGQCFPTCDEAPQSCTAILEIPPKWCENLACRINSGE